MPGSTGMPGTSPAGESGVTAAAQNFQGKDPWAKVSLDGETVDNFTAAALQAAATEAGTDWHVMQGSFSNDVAASGSTHTGGGVVDMDPANGDWEGAVTALRKIGFAAWIRNVPGHGYAGSGEHIHAVLMGDEQISDQAAIQVQSYLNDDNGLEGSAPDDGPRQFVDNRFSWEDISGASTGVDRRAWRRPTRSAAAAPPPPRRTTRSTRERRPRRWGTPTATDSPTRSREPGARPIPADSDRDGTLRQRRVPRRE